tara:strand:- start:110 stop:214 length:105 start_codon:yes stop_codon:yes gene_type:complete
MIRDMGIARIPKDFIKTKIEITPIMDDISNICAY